MKVQHIKIQLLFHQKNEDRNCKRIFLFMHEHKKDRIAKQSLNSIRDINNKYFANIKLIHKLTNHISICSKYLIRFFLFFLDIIKWVYSVKSTRKIVFVLIYPNRRLFNKFRTVSLIVNFLSSHKIYFRVVVFTWTC